MYFLNQWRDTEFKNGTAQTDWASYLYPNESHCIFLCLLLSLRLLVQHPNSTHPSNLRPNLPLTRSLLWPNLINNKNSSQHLLSTLRMLVSSLETLHLFPLILTTLQVIISLTKLRNWGKEIYSANRRYISDSNLSILSLSSFYYDICKTQWYLYKIQSDK